MFTAALPVLEGSCPQPHVYHRVKEEAKCGAPEALTAVRSAESEVPMATCVYLKNTVFWKKIYLVVVSFLKGHFLLEIHSEVLIFLGEMI